MTQSDNFYSKPTSIYWACQALINGRTITHKDEMTEMGAWRLGAIIHRLRAEFSWPILVDYRGSLKVAHYSLDPKANKSNLLLPASATTLVVEGDQT